MRWKEKGHGGLVQQRRIQRSTSPSRKYLDVLVLPALYVLFRLVTVEVTNV